MIILMQTLSLQRTAPIRIGLGTYSQQLGCSDLLIRRSISISISPTKA